MNGIPEQRLYLQRITKNELGQKAMISGTALGILDSLIAEATIRFTNKASDYVFTGEVVTMRKRHVEAAVRMVSNGDLSQEMLVGMSQAVVTYERNRKDRENTSSSKTQAAGLILSTPRIDRTIRLNMTCRNLGETATITMTAALEAVARRLVRGALKAAVSDRKRKKITPHYIMLAIHNDPDLRILFKGVHIAGSGVVPMRRTPFKRKRASAKKRRSRQIKKQKKEK